MSKIPNSKSQITNSQTNFRETVFRLPSQSLCSTLFFFPLPKKEPEKATAKEHLTGVRLVPANGI